MGKHALVRTSPKGQDFVGTCTKCGRDGLTLKDMANDECENVRDIKDQQALVEILMPRKRT